MIAVQASVGDVEGSSFSVAPACQSDELGPGVRRTLKEMQLQGVMFSITAGSIFKDFLLTLFHTFPVFRGSTRQSELQFGPCCCCKGLGTWHSLELFSEPPLGW